DNSDSQSLFELIFYPEQSHQIYLEPELEAGALEKSENRAVEDRLAEKRLRPRLVFPEGGKTGGIQLPENIVRQYVRRLNLTRQIPRQVGDAIRAHIQDADRALSIRVRLRNTRFSFSGEVVSFLCAYLEKVPAASEADLQRLDLALSLLDHVPEKTDIYTAMMAHKHHCEEMIRRADTSEKRLRSQPVEALIMQGVNIPCISAQRARHRIGMIDEIALRVFGKTEITGPAETGGQSPINLGALNTARNLDRMIKILS
ncbi:MAG: hypothetical protein ACOCS6_03300, partial [Desulfosalsimonas sp.]